MGLPPAGMAPSEQTWLAPPSWQTIPLFHVEDEWLAPRTHAGAARDFRLCCRMRVQAMSTARLNLPPEPEPEREPERELRLPAARAWRAP